MQDKYVTISRINNYLKAYFDNNPHLQHVYLKGEISNFKNHSRGHLYFTLKDEQSRLSAVMFQTNALKLNFEPEDGMNVLVEGRISCYPAQGSYQIYVEKMEVDGVGNLYIEFEKLKKKLAAEGLFDPKFKKQIPKYPTRIGVITAPTGAAIKDILSTIKRRYPICETILFPCLVQGKSAAPDIVNQIKTAQDYDLDVIICGRGGGSIEDLWAFNEEIVARAIFESKIPIISAVGHEIDFTIADFVSDLRAPTPTGAAEMAVPTISDVKFMINQLTLRTNKCMNNIIEIKKNKLNAIKDSFILKNPLSIYEIKEQKLDMLIDNLNKNVKNILVNKNHELVLLANTLKLVNPLNILDRGYSVVKKDNKVIKDIKDIKKEDNIDIRIKNGNIKAKVLEVNNG